MYEKGICIPIEEVFKYPIRSDGKKINKLGFSDDGFACKTKVGEFEGEPVICNLSSQRIQLFKHGGTVCKCCGLKGSFFRAERPSKEVSYHLNLYGINKDGVEILFTKDHIVPKSKGGSNSLRNYNTMCETCNNFKSNKILNLFDLRHDIIETFQKDERFDSLDKNNCLERVLKMKLKETQNLELTYINRMEDLNGE